MNKYMMKKINKPILTEILVPDAPVLTEVPETINDSVKIAVYGNLKIRDKLTGEILVNKRI